MNTLQQPSALVIPVLFASAISFGMAIAPQTTPSEPGTSSPTSPE